MRLNKTRDIDYDSRLLNVLVSHTVCLVAKVFFGNRRKIRSLLWAGFSLNFLIYITHNTMDLRMIPAKPCPLLWNLGVRIKLFQARAKKDTDLYIDLAHKPSSIGIGGR